MRRIVLIGYGAIAHMVCDRLKDHADRVRIAGVLVRERRAAETRAEFGADTQVITDMGDIARIAPNLVVECAGQEAVKQYAEDVLRAGIDLMVISTGALADDATRARLVAAAEATGARIVLPAGAIAGIDGLMAHRIGGLKSVRYTSTKPPYAWKGTPAEEAFDLDLLAGIGPRKEFGSQDDDWKPEGRLGFDLEWEVTKRQSFDFNSAFFPVDRIRNKRQLPP